MACRPTSSSPFPSLPFPISITIPITIHSLGTAQAQGVDWVAFFRQGDCKQAHVNEDGTHLIDFDESQRHTQNSCYLATAPIP